MTTNIAEIFTANFLLFLMALALSALIAGIILIPIMLKSDTPVKRQWINARRKPKHSAMYQVKTCSGSSGHPHSHWDVSKYHRGVFNNRWTSYWHAEKHELRTVTYWRPIL